MSLQGFDDVALMPGEAAMVIHNFENWTGHTISMAELESGFLKGQLRLEDYNLKQQVCMGSFTILTREPLSVPTERVHSYAYPKSGPSL